MPAYLDMDQLIAIAAAQGCDAIHPGYGFLAENAEFARRCQAAGISFIGPAPEVLELFGDKAAARALAERCGVPLVAGINQAQPGTSPGLLRRAWRRDAQGSGRRAAAACAQQPERRHWPKPTPAASPRPRRRSVTAPCTLSSW